MASVAPRDLKVGTILDKMLAVVERCMTPALLYFVAVGGLNVAFGYLTLGSTAPLAALSNAGLKFVVGVIAAFLLLSAMIRKTGLGRRTDGDVILSYLVLSVVYIAGVILGFIALVLPGFYIMSRWIVAQPLLIARGGSPMKALGESWERTKDTEFQIILALLVIFVPVIIVSITATAMLGQGNLLGLVISEFVSSAGGVLTLAMSVAILGVMDARERAATGSGDPRMGA